MGYAKSKVALMDRNLFLTPCGKFTVATGLLIRSYILIFNDRLSQGEYDIGVFGCHVDLGDSVVLWTFKVNQHMEITSADRFNGLNTECKIEDNGFVHANFIKEYFRYYKDGLVNLKDPQNLASAWFTPVRP